MTAVWFNCLIIENQTSFGVFHRIHCRKYIFRSEDVKDEGEDFLNEALEKALAELSPVNTDDEEDVSNADDLLLEIEEMINS